MKPVGTLPISVQSTKLPSDALFDHCDFCWYGGKKYLLSADHNTITIYCDTILSTGEKKMQIVQIIQDEFISDSITSIRWCKNASTQISKRGEFAVVSSSFLTIYAPCSYCTLSPDYNCYKVRIVVLIFIKSGFVVELSMLIKESTILVGVMIPTY